MNVDENELYAGLKKYFGFSVFRGLQEDVVKSILSGHDTFVIMPTGGGKSLCYQLPALMSEGTAIVVSPLIALMKNQVDAIRGISDHSGVAHVLNSSLNKGDVERVKEDIRSGVTKLLYVAPESLTKDEYVDFLKDQSLSFVAIDEAHCISEWGHVFRPEYRNLKSIISRIDDVPVIGLTATATEKVQEDIIKTLGMHDANVFKASFNRPNLFYEVRPKTAQVNSDIIRFVREREGKSGIIYCLSRKKVEEVAQLLQVNGLNAIPYHAGLEAKVRARHQDMFLMEEADIVVATIAFGMGIDKPDVRFVIHYDMPKSLESYYQETGRAGRDGGEGYCLAFYAYKDIEKLEKFMSGKPVAEQEIGHALLQDVVAYAETAMSRRKYLLHYFGEDFDEVNGLGADMDDNTRNPKKREQAQNQLLLLLEVVRDTKEKYKMKDLAATMVGQSNAMLKSHKTDQKPFFGCGKDKDISYWIALIRQGFVNDFLKKELELYGVLKLTDKGWYYIDNPSSFMMTYDHVYSDEDKVNVIKPSKISGGDKLLMKQLKELRKKVGAKNGVPPFAVFQDPSLEDMCLKYPITMDELLNIHGVGEGKARKFGKPFIDLIKLYVEDNGITRADDLVVKSTGENSGLKLFVIQNTDKKIPLDDIAKAKGLEMDAFIKILESIVFSGTKINIDYYLEDILDEDQMEEIFDYFMEAESDKIQEALDEFDGDYDEEELRLMRIKFINDVAN
ncbi:MAG: RecQ family ATP-dependent DNA helicase [Flavobacteriaceae bacterium]